MEKEVLLPSVITDSCSSPSPGNSCVHDSDSDFEIQPQIVKRKRRKCDVECDLNGKLLNWDELPADVQPVLPPDDKYSYVLQSHQKQDTKSFEGAPEFAFNAVIRINLENPEDITTWLNKMMETSACTYRITRGGHKPVGKRLLCKHEMHCQHYKKPLTSMQLKQSATATAS